MGEESNGFLVEGTHMPNSILSTLDDHRKNGIWCDLRLEIPTPENRNIYFSEKEENCTKSTIFDVHSCVVAAASKSLAIIADKKLEHAMLPDMNSHYVALCLNYIYGRKIFVPLRHLPGLLECAEKLQLDPLTKLCRHSLDNVKLEDISPLNSDDNFPDSEGDESPVDSFEDSEATEDKDSADFGPENEQNVSDNRASQLHTCSQCPLKFKSLDLLKWHEIRHSEGYAPPLLHCSTCYFTCSTKKEFAQHKITHETKQKASSSSESKGSILDLSVESEEVSSSKVSVPFRRSLRTPKRKFAQQSFENNSDRIKKPKTVKSSSLEKSDLFTAKSVSSRVEEEKVDPVGRFQNDKNKVCDQNAKSANEHSFIGQGDSKSADAPYFSSDEEIITKSSIRSQVKRRIRYQGLSKNKNEDFDCKRPLVNDEIKSEPKADFQESVLFETKDENKDTLSLKTALDTCELPEALKGSPCPSDTFDNDLEAPESNDNSQLLIHDSNVKLETVHIHLETDKSKRKALEKSVSQDSNEVTFTVNKMSGLLEVLPPDSNTTSLKDESFDNRINDDQIKPWKRERFDNEHHPGTDKDSQMFDDIAEELKIPSDIREILADILKWPEYLKKGRFVGKPRTAYRYYYENSFQEFTCEMCGDVIKGKQRFDIHVKKEMGDFHYCSFCGKQFVSKGALKTHEMRHKEQKNFKCDQCDFAAYFKCFLKKHKQKVHNEEGGPDLHICSQCPKSFKTLQTLKIHELKVHDPERWKEVGHKCSLCKYIGYSKKDVELHMARHSEHKPHICYICKRMSFRRRKELNKHIREKHNEEPKFRKSLKLVDKSYSNENEDIEENVELLPPLPKGPKTFSCPHCEYTTPNSQNLKAHVVIHFDDRPHLCPICQLGFKRKNVMVRHAWRLHKIDLRNACYEVSDTGKRKRKDLENKLIVVSNPASTDLQALVAQVESGDVANVETVLDQIHVSQDQPQLYAEAVGDAITIDAQSKSFDLRDSTDEPLLFEADGANNLDIIREVVVDSGTVNVPSEGGVVDEDIELVPTVSQQTISVPIQDASGLTAETEIVLDSNVLKAMGLENFTTAQWKIITDSDA